MVKFEALIFLNFFQLGDARLVVQVLPAQSFEFSLQLDHEVLALIYALDQFLLEFFLGGCQVPHFIGHLVVVELETLSFLLGNPLADHLQLGVECFQVPEHVIGLDWLLLNKHALQLCLAVQCLLL